MSKIVDYVVIGSSEEGVLQEEIIKYSKQDYVLAGGLSVSPQIDPHNENCESFDMLYQAMVKYEQNS